MERLCVRQTKRAPKKKTKQRLNQTQKQTKWWMMQMYYQQRWTFFFSLWLTFVSSTLPKELLTNELKSHVSSTRCYPHKITCKLFVGRLNKIRGAVHNQMHQKQCTRTSILRLWFTKYFSHPLWLCPQNVCIRLNLLRVTLATKTTQKII